MDYTELLCGGGKRQRNTHFSIRGYYFKTKYYYTIKIRKRDTTWDGHI